MNTLIIHSAPTSSAVHELASNGGKTSLHIGTANQDSISLIFAPSEAKAVANVLLDAVIKLLALARASAVAA